MDPDKTPGAPAETPGREQPFADDPAEASESSERGAASCSGCPSCRVYRKVTRGFSVDTADPAVVEAEMVAAGLPPASSVRPPITIVVKGACISAGEGEYRNSFRVKPPHVRFPSAFCRQSHDIITANVRQQIAIERALQLSFADKAKGFPALKDDNGRYWVEGEDLDKAAHEFVKNVRDASARAIYKTLYLRGFKPQFEVPLGDSESGNYGEYRTAAYLYSCPRP